MKVWIDQAKVVVTRADGAVEETEQPVLCSRDDHGRVSEWTTVLTTRVDLATGDSFSITWSEP